MKSKKFIKLVSVLSMLFITVSLVACKQQGTNTGTDAAAQKETKQTAQGTSSDSEPAVQIHVLGAHFGWVGPDRENLIREEIKKRTGVDIDYETWQCSSQDEYRKKLNMWVASGEFPCDVLLGNNGVFSVTMFNSMGEKGQLWELDDYVKNHQPFMDFASHTFPKYRNPNNGKLYGYPYHINNPDFFNVKDAGLSIRVDWMKQLGFDYPKNPEDYFNLLKAMKEKIKVADGSTVIPLSLANDGQGINYLGAQFLGGYGSKFWEKEVSGQYVIPMYSFFDKTTNFAVYMNKLWREGLLDKEAFTQKKEQLIEKASAGKIGASASLRHNEQAQINDLLWGTSKDSMMVFMPSFPDMGIEKAAVQVCSQWGMGYTVFPKSTPAEKVEAYFKLADFVLSQEGTILTCMGMEGQQWEMDAEGKCKFKDDFIAKYPSENERQKFGLWIYQSSAADWCRIDQYSAIKPEYLRPDYKANIANMNDKYTQTDIAYGAFPGNTEQQKLTSIDEAWKQVLVKAIMSKSEQECREILGEFPGTLEKLGYKEIVKERNEIIGKLVK